MEIKQPLGRNKMHYLSPINLFFFPSLFAREPKQELGVGGSAASLKTEGTYQAPWVNLALIHPFVGINRLWNKPTGCYTE